MESWAVDLATVGAIYPWQGSEVIMAIAGIVAWLLWHVVQMKDESREYQEDMKAHGSKEKIRAALDRDV